jgi:hypothetical protein
MNEKVIYKNVSKIYWKNQMVKLLLPKNFQTLDERKFKKVFSARISLLLTSLNTSVFSVLLFHTCRRQETNI